MPSRQLAAALCLPALCLAGCVQQHPASMAAASSYSADLVGRAANCTAPPVVVADGHDAAGTINTGGGGWCGIPVTRDGKPVGAALLTQPARSGSVYVHTVGSETRVDYTPYSGKVADGFTIKFIPGDETMRVTVNAPPAQVAK